MYDSQNHNSFELRKERDDFERRLGEATAQVANASCEKDLLAVHLANKEVATRRLEESEQKAAMKLCEVKLELESAIKAKESVFGELKDSRYEVASLRGQVENLQKSLEQREGNLGKERNRIAEKLKCRSCCFVQVENHQPRVLSDPSNLNFKYCQLVGNILYRTLNK